MKNHQNVIEHASYILSDLGPVFHVVYKTTCKLHQGFQKVENEMLYFSIEVMIDYYGIVCQILKWARSFNYLSYH